MTQAKIWTKDFNLLIASNFLVAITFYLLMTSMALYAVQQFDSSPSSAGLAASIFVIGALFARLIAGKYIDGIGRKKSLLAGLVLFLIASVLYLTISGLVMLMLIRFIHGLAFGVVATILSTASLSSLPPDRRGEGIGYFSLSTASATAIGPFLALFLSQQYGYLAIFISCIIFSSLALVSALFGKVQEVKLTDKQRATVKTGFKLEDFFEKSALPISLLMVFCGIGYSSIISFINSYALEINLTSAASVFFLIYAIFLFVSRPLSGKLFDKRGENTVVYPSFVFFAVSLLLIGIASHSMMLLLAAVFLAFGYGTLISSMQAIAVKVSPNHRMTLTISTFFICMDSGMGFGPYILGLIVPIVGFRGMYIMLSAIILLLAFFYYLVHGRKAARAV